MVRSCIEANRLSWEIRAKGSAGVAVGSTGVCVGCGVNVGDGTTVGVEGVAIGARVSVGTAVAVGRGVCVGTVVAVGGTVVSVGGIDLALGEDVDFAFPQPAIRNRAMIAAATSLWRIGMFLFASMLFHLAVARQTNTTPFH